MSSNSQSTHVETLNFSNENVSKEYNRILEAVGPGDPYITKVTIGLHEVLHAHFLLGRELIKWSGAEEAPTIGSTLVGLR